MRWFGTLCLVVVACVGAGWWAGRATLTPSTGPQQVAAPTAVTVEVTNASVGRTLSLNVSVTQPFELVASNVFAGVVTKVGKPSASVGSTLYSVAGNDVHAVRGAVPFWRDLRVGESGADVRELQGALRTLGFFSGRASGTYDASTARAVRAWQTKTGATITGEVPLGVVVAVPELPSTVRLDPAIVKGAVLAGGEKAVFSPTGEPRFSLVVSSEQATMIPADAHVDVQSGERTWHAVVTRTTTDENGNTVLALVGRDGGTVCGRECAALPAKDTTSLPSKVQVVRQVSGPSVPVAAVVTDASGATTVQRAEGSLVQVKVLGSDEGTAVVEGLKVGERVIALPVPTHGTTANARATP